MLTISESRMFSKMFTIIPTGNVKLREGKIAL
jgi:hypothetical protein